MTDLEKLLESLGSNETAITVLPEHDLWHACLAQAVRGAQQGEREDFYWCFSEHDDLGSYKWICDILNIDHMLVREQIIAKNPSLPRTSGKDGEAFYPEQLLK